MSASKLFHNASHFSIQGSEFNAVAGDLVVTNNFHGPTTTSVSGRMFRVLPSGDVIIIQRLHERKSNSVKAVRCINTVQVVGLGESQKFTAVIYKGPQARQAFEDDLGRYSEAWHPNVAQLFGIIQSDIPALIFHSELIPITYFANQYTSNPFAQVYLKHRYVGQ
ncbi:hypothetical protein BT96DRAFT_224374 [Gymnopus androsaceus JB14]|uniref:Serine-threonine/tyrosine-protein kinase catalytic domain-containing protein n=1 Tax=Gymnopus androsaceus JB14 TaxID=1447944 RepID=A0A6A4H888_9AGAR|nr:hypothetical protein BT96DRAFT_224374 [Gymnopus androsaceus JB14]